MKMICTQCFRKSYSQIFCEATWDTKTGNLGDRSLLHLSEPSTVSWDGLRDVSSGPVARAGTLSSNRRTHAHTWPDQSKFFCSFCLQSNAFKCSQAKKSFSVCRGPQNWWERIDYYFFCVHFILVILCVCVCVCPVEVFTHLPLKSKTFSLLCVCPTGFGCRQGVLPLFHFSCTSVVLVSIPPSMCVCLSSSLLFHVSPVCLP